MKKFRIDIEPCILHFKRPARTSRGEYLLRHLWLVKVCDPLSGEILGVGECAPLLDLSADYSADYEHQLRRFCDQIELSGEIPSDLLRDYPSILFGLESAFGCFDPNSFLSRRNPLSIPINGLVWMGSYERMLAEMQEKLDAGFRCIKFKIGAIDFDKELDLIRTVRAHFPQSAVEIRVDANGAFKPDEAMRKLEALAKFDIHSIEQPIRQGNWPAMADLCLNAPLKIALDEELIGVNHPDDKLRLIETINPAFLVLKPTLHGAFTGCREWIELADSHGIGSWITSALESNIGLMAITRFAADVYGPDITFPQGLGTGALFTDNFPMPLKISCGRLLIDS